MIAQLQLPGRRIGLLEIFERALHRPRLRLHAALLPLAVDADIERDRVAERRTRVRRRRERGQCNDSNRKRPPHMVSMPSVAANGKLELIRAQPFQEINRKLLF